MAVEAHDQDNQLADARAAGGELDEPPVPAQARPGRPEPGAPRRLRAIVRFTRGRQSDKDRGDGW